MPEVIDCPSCGRKLNLPEGLLGRLVKCPTCATAFTAPEANGATPPPAPPPEAGETAPPEDPAPPADPVPERAPERRRRQTASRRTRCPSCREAIPVTAVECPFCGEPLDDEDERPWEGGRGLRRDCEPHRGGLVLTLGILSLAAMGGALVSVCCPPLGVPFVLISLALGIPAWVMGQGDLRKMDARIMDPAGEGQTRGGMVCGIIGTCLTGLVAVAAVLFFAAMLLSS